MVKTAVGEMCSKMGELLTPIWTGDVAFQESVMVLADEDGSTAPIQMLYPATEILKVQSSDLQTTYTEGADYALDEEGRLVIVNGGSIPVTPYQEVHLDAELPGKSFQKEDGGYLRFSEHGFYHKRQIAVTYRHAQGWYGAIPKRQGSRLLKTRAKLEGKQPLHILFYGDSITAGANASGTMGLPPYLPRFSDIVVEEWKTQYGYEDIHMTNTAVGGKNCFWGVEQAKERVAAYAPDLLVLGFGMNGHAEPEEHRANLLKIIDIARGVNPECEVILIATTLPNRILPHFWRKQALYLAEAKKIAEENQGIAVAEMTTMHQDLLQRKRFVDMTGNNVNHPNDYLTRVYAQVLLETMKI